MRKWANVVIILDWCIRHEVIFVVRLGVVKVERCCGAGFCVFVVVGFFRNENLEKELIWGLVSVISVVCAVI